jgi:hypothetical protein
MWAFEKVGIAAPGLYPASRGQGSVATGLTAVRPGLRGRPQVIEGTAIPGCNTTEPSLLPGGCSATKGLA